LTTQNNSIERDPLLDFVAGVTGDEVLQVEEDLGFGFVRLNTAEAERRQARHDIRQVEDIIVEMMRNARDAGATHIFIATSKSESMRHITIIDDGEGVPTGLSKHIFEARVTSKLTSISEDEWGVHGRGMALYSIEQNTSSLVLSATGDGLGASFNLEVDTDELKERADQSTWPKVEREADGSLVCATGPKNLLRHISEFALIHPNLKIFVGSPNEILASLIAYGEGKDMSAAHVFKDGDNLADDSDKTGDENPMPVCLRPSDANDPYELSDCAASLGLDVSTRSAYRIENGEIAPLSDVYKFLSKSLPQEQGAVDLSQDLRGLKIDKQDLAELATQVERAFDQMAEKYYISACSDPKLSIKKNTLTIKLDFEKEY
jgi:hypothetical protein